jgi:hypothetical protein
METVNCTREKCSHYCGRNSSAHKALGSPVNLSILGNLFFLGPEDARGSTIARYRVWLNEQRIKNAAAWKALVALPEDAVLGCFCAPRACHCDVIIDAWKWQRASTQEEPAATGEA